MEGVKEGLIPPSSSVTTGTGTRAPPCLCHALPSGQGLEVVEGNHLGLDEAALEIRVDHSGGLRVCGAGVWNGFGGSAGGILMG